jgi:hypothetical protein
MAAAAVMKPPMMKVLYNNCYGGFNLSAEFQTEYACRTGKEMTDYQQYSTGSGSIRVDPVAHAIFEEHGSEWSSGLMACIKIREIPTALANYWEIDEYDGDETVRVNVQWALADILETYIQTGDHAAMLDQYRHIKTAQQQMMRGFKEALSS